MPEAVDGAVKNWTLSGVAVVVFWTVTVNCLSLISSPAVAQPLILYSPLGPVVVSQVKE